MDDIFEQLAHELKNTFDKNFYTKARFIPSATETVDIFEHLKDWLFQYSLSSKDTSTPGALQNLSARL
jgi:hypothetical protein